jgi:hypothetical protein
MLLHHPPGLEKGIFVGIPKNEIIDLALRYVSADEIADFPFDGDIFCMLSRELPPDRIVPEEEGWTFNGYGICTGYTFDEDAKPHGKWLWMHFASLALFPPVAQTLKLQPPHVVKGRFQSADRTHEIRIVKVSLAPGVSRRPVASAKQPPKKRTVRKKAPSPADNIVAFRKKTPS